MLNSIFLKALPTLTVLLLAHTVSCGVELTPSNSAFHRLQGERFFVSCKATGTRVQRLLWVGPDGAQIKPYAGRIFVPPRVHVEDSQFSGEGLNIIFENISVAEQGTYSCEAWVDGKEEQREFNLIVNRRASFERTPPHQILEEGRNSTLHCGVEGQPEPRVSWRRNGVRVTNDGKYKKSSGPPYQLTVLDVTSEDAGLYFCDTVQVSTAVSYLEHFPINVTVHHAPRSSPAKDGINYGFLGGRVNLTCSVIALPHPSFEWLRNGQPIASDSSAVGDDSRRWSYTVGENANAVEGANNFEKLPRGSPYRVFTEGSTSYLQVEITKASMFGDYECKATNNLGTFEKVVVLMEGKRPPKPSIRIVKYSSDYLTLTIDSPEGSSLPHEAVTGFTVAYHKAGEANWKQLEFEEGMDYRVEGLTPHTVYVVKVASRNRAGVSQYSRQIMQKTSGRGRSLVGALSSTAANTSPVYVFSLLIAGLFLLF